MSYLKTGEWRKGVSSKFHPLLVKCLFLIAIIIRLQRYAIRTNKASIYTILNFSTVKSLKFEVHGTSALILD